MQYFAIINGPVGGVDPWWELDVTRIQAKDINSVPKAMKDRGWDVHDSQTFVVIPLDGRDALPEHARVYVFEVAAFPPAEPTVIVDWEKL